MRTTSYLDRSEVQILPSELILPEWGMHKMQGMPHLQLNWLSYLFLRVKVGFHAFSLCLRK